MRFRLSAPLLLVFLATETRAGPYSGARNDPANPHDSPLPAFIGPDGDGFRTGANRPNPLFVAWASAVQAYAPAPVLDEAWTASAPALGHATGDQFDVLSLGDLDAAALDAGVAPGTVTLSFPFAITDGPGPDFAVFENGFAGFMELAFVEVSSDGARFARFPAVSLTAAPVPAYTPFDPTGVFNLAGKHHNNNDEAWGTPFDLAALRAHTAVTGGVVNLAGIRFVRLVDVPGRGDFTDAGGRPVHDPWPTFGSGGFDLEAIGIIHARVDLFGRPAAGMDILGWTTVPNRVNRLWSCDTLGGPWTLRHAAPGDGVAWSLDLPSAPVRRHYRVELQPLPAP